MITFADLVYDHFLSNMIILRFFWYNTWTFPSLMMNQWRCDRVNTVSGNHHNYLVDLFIYLLLFFLRQCVVRSS